MVGNSEGLLGGASYKSLIGFDVYFVLSLIDRLWTLCVQVGECLWSLLRESNARWQFRQMALQIEVGDL